MYKLKLLFAQSCFLLNACIYLYLSIASLLITYFIDVNLGYGEGIVLKRDHFTVNVIVIVLIVGLITYFLHLLEKRNVSLGKNRVSIYLIILLFTYIWVVGVSHSPDADQRFILSMAQKFYEYGKGQPINDDFLIHYYQMYPFQLGMTFYAQILYSIAPKLRHLFQMILNPIWMVLTYEAIYKISDHLFDQNTSQQNLLILIFCTALQPLFMTTFIYGLIPSLVCSAWSIYFFITMKDHKNNVYWCFILLVLSILLKQNARIISIAFAICYFLKHHGIVKKICISALFVGLPVFAMNFLQYAYQQIYGVDFGKGFSQKIYLYIGLSDGEKAPGWYADPEEVIYRFDMPIDQREQIGLVYAKDRLSYFMDHPLEGLKFFHTKFTTQWLEPSFESIQVSQVRGHILPLLPIFDAFYHDPLNTWIFIYFDKILNVLYVGAAVCLWKLARSADENLMLIPIINLGAMIYHLIFEAKSQYAIPYYILMFPYFAYGLLLLSKYLKSSCKNVLSEMRLNNAV